MKLAAGPALRGPNPLIAKELPISGYRRRALTTQKALATEHRTPLGGLEGNRGFPAALGAGGHGFGLAESTAASALALSLAPLTAFGFVLEILVVEEVLFSRCKYEVCPAIYAL
jgi:hypothetical protein